MRWRLLGLVLRVRQSGDGDRARAGHVRVVRGERVSTVPLPVPDAPEVMVIHATLLVAVHGQPAPAVTVIM